MYHTMFYIFTSASWIHMLGEKYGKPKADSEYGAKKVLYTQQPTK